MVLSVIITLSLSIINTSKLIARVMCRFLRYMPKMLKHVKELFLTYISPVHYNTIRSSQPKIKSSGDDADV